MYKQKENLERKIAREKIIQSRLLHLPEVSAQILVVVKEQGRVAINDLYSLIKANPNTIKAHVQRMVKGNLLMQHGKGKATWYTLGSTHLFAESSDEK